LVVLREPKIYHDLADFTRIVDFTWRLSDCEELVGVIHRRLLRREIIESR